MNRLQKAYIGVSSAKNNLENVIKTFSPLRVFLVRGNNSYALSGAKTLIESNTTQKGIDLIAFSDFTENPKEEDVIKGVCSLEAQRVDLIIATGGGSVMDMAKLLRFRHSYARLKNNNFKKIKELIPLIAMPTTAGTGAEATHFAVLYDNKVKYSISHPDILPDIAIVDPSFTYTNSPYLTACSGFDALSQGIEAYWNVNATAESDKYAIKAIELIYPNLLLAINNDLEARNKISEGAYLAGKAINITKTTAPHAFSYPFTSYYNYPHGHAVALTFPFFTHNMNIPENEYKGKLPLNEYNDKMNHLRSLLKLETGKEYDLMKNYILSTGLSFTLPQIFDENIILKNINMERLDNNPRVFNFEHGTTFFATFAATVK